MTIEADEQLWLLDPDPADEVPRIYLASPLTNLERDERLSLLSQVENVKNRIDRMTVGDRAHGEGWPVSVYAPIEHTPPWGATASARPRCTSATSPNCWIPMR